MISLSAVAYAVLWIIIAGLIFYLLNWAIDYCHVPEPFNRVARVLIVVLAVMVMIGILLNLGGVLAVRP